MNNDYFEQLAEIIRDIASSEREFHSKIESLYSLAADYDSRSPKTRSFFTQITNKLYYAASGKTTAELIYERADATKPNMGLKRWKNQEKGEVEERDVFIAKNYLLDNEISILEKLISIIFDYAILQAQRKIVMRTVDLEERIESILNIPGSLTTLDSISSRTAREHAKSEYKKYKEGGSDIEGGHIYFRGVSIENLRTFGQRQRISFVDEKNETCMWNVIIGDNGIGKTSILKALCLPLFKPWGNALGVLKADFKTFERFDSKKRPKVDIEFEYEKAVSVEENTLQLEVLTYGNGLHSQLRKFPQNATDWIYKKAFLLFAYGASRRIGTKGISTESNFSAQTIFDDNATLINAEEWIIQSDYKAEKERENYSSYYRKVLSILKTLLKDEIDDIKIEIINNTPKILFKTRYGWVQLHELSLGYKTLLSWVVDFVKGMLDKYPESENPLQEPAICLVDEIDLHIHPALQNKVIKFLSDTFTKTQFIVTAHSPIVVQALENANIILLKDKGKSVEVQQNIVDIKNWRIDQILMSDLFGLEDTYSVDTQNKLEQREKLLRKERLSSREEEDLKQLNDFAEQLPVGNNQNEIEGFALLRQFAEKIAKNQNKSGHD